MSEGFCVVGSDDGFLRVWPLDFTDYLLEAENESAVTSVALSPDGLQICAGTQNGTISVLDIVSRTHETLLRSHTDTVNCISVLPSTRQQHQSVQFLTGSADGTMRQWMLTHPSDLVKNQRDQDHDALDVYFENMPNEEETTEECNHTICCQSYEFRCMNDAVTCTATTTTGNLIATGFRSSWIRVFNVDDVIMTKEFQLAGSAVMQIEFVNEDTELIAVNGEGTAVVYDVLNCYRPIRQLCLSCKGVPLCFAWNEAMQLIATAAVGRRGFIDLSCLNVRTLQPEHSFDNSCENCDRLVFTEDGKQLWALDALSASLRVFNVVSGVCVHRWQHQHLAGRPVVCLDRSGRFFLTGDAKGVIRVWSISNDDRDESRSFDEIQKFCGPPSVITDLKIVRDFVISVGEGDCIFVWKIHRHELNASFATSSPVSSHVDFSPQDDAETVLSGVVSDKRHTQLHDSLTFHPEPFLLGVSTEFRSNFVWHATSAFFAFTVGSSIIVEDLETRKRQTLKHHQTSVGALCLSEDGLLLGSASSGVEISGCADVCIWHCASKRLTALLQHHTSGIQALAFSLDSTWLISVSRGAPCHVVVWDVASQTPVAVARMEVPCLDVQFLKDSLDPRFISVSPRELFLWQLQVDGLHQTAVSLEMDCQSWITSAVTDLSGRVYCVTSAGQLMLLENGDMREVGIPVPSDKVSSMAVCGHHFVFGTESGQLFLFRLCQQPEASFACCGSIDLKAEVLAIELDACCETALVNTMDARIWRVHLADLTAEPVVTGPGGHLSCWSTMPSKDNIHAVVAEGKHLRIFKTPDLHPTSSEVPEQLLMERTFSKNCTCIELLPSGSAIVCSFEDGSLLLQHSDSQEARSSLGSSPVERKHPIVKLSVDEPRQTVLALSKEGILAAHDLTIMEQSAILCEPRGKEESVVSDICPRNTFLALGWPHKFTVTAIHLESRSISTITEQTVIESPEDCPEHLSVCVTFGYKATKCHLFYTTSLQMDRVWVMDLTMKTLTHVSCPREIAAPISALATVEGTRIAFAVAGQSILHINADRNEAYCVIPDTQGRVLGLRWNDQQQTLSLLHSNHIAMWSTGLQH